MHQALRSLQAGSLRAGRTRAVTACMPARAMSTASGGCPHQAAASAKADNAGQEDAPDALKPVYPLKPFSAMPGYPGLLDFRHFMPKDPRRPFDVWQKCGKEKGSVYRINIMGTHMVLSSDPKHWATIHQFTGKHPGPLQNHPSLFREAERKMRDPDYDVNLVAKVGEDWRENRTVLDEVFSIPARVESHLPEVGQIADDLVETMREGVKAGNGPAALSGTTIELAALDYTNEIVGQITYGCRMGGLTGEGKSASADKFCNMVSEIFTTNSRLIYTLPLYKFVPSWMSPLYSKYDRMMSEMEELGKDLVKLADVHHAEHPDQPRKDLLAHMRSSGQDEARVLQNSSTMFLAGSDSTTHTVLWLLYNLGCFPEVQEKVREEVGLVLPNPGDKVTAEALASCKYLKAVMRESMRYTPSISGVPRLNVVPTNVHGYEVPPDTLIFMNSWVVNRDPDVYDDPDTFRPERWMETARSKRPNPWAHRPFGHGPRMCQAFRLADMESAVCAVKLLQNFRWRATHQDVEPVADLFIRADRPLPLVWETLA